MDLALRCGCGFSFESFPKVFFVFFSVFDGVFVVDEVVLVEVVGVVVVVETQAFAISIERYS